jgi:hypothetical protein
MDDWAADKAKYQYLSTFTVKSQRGVALTFRDRNNSPKFLLRCDGCFWYNVFSDRRSTNLSKVAHPLFSAGERAALFVHATLRSESRGAAGGVL